MVLERGTVFAGYRIERLLGAGGMAAVYLAEHPRLPRWDAVKILDTSTISDTMLAHRFQREAELAARLTHRNIVTVYDRGIEGDRLWIAMQYVEGTDADRLARSGTEVPPTRQAVHIVREAARGLDHAHSQGLLHRDVKPANLLVADARDDDGDPLVLVTDFGIARAFAESVVLTGTGAIVGTPAFVAPEQIEGAELDGRTDVYALGASLYTMLTGAPPFLGATPLAAIHAHLTRRPPRPSEIDSRLAPFDDVIATAMAKKRDDRYPTCRDLAAAAAAAFDRTVAPPPSAPSPSAPSPPTSSRTAPSRPAPESAVTIHERPPTPADRSDPAESSEAAWQAAYPDLSAGSSRAQRWAVAAAAAVIAIIAIIVWGGAATDHSTTSGASTASTVPTTPATPPWGAGQFIAEKFPGLIPTAPDNIGYRGATCSKPAESGFVLPAAQDRSSYWIFCDSNGLQYSINCSRDGSSIDPLTPEPERWQRRSSTGTLLLGESGKSPSSAWLTATFDQPQRSRCLLLVNASGWTASELRHTWWESAPI